MAKQTSSKTTSAKPKKRRKKLSEAMIIALISVAGTIIAGFLSSPLIGGQLDPLVTLGPTPTLSLHPDAIGPVQTLTSLANTVAGLEQSNMTQSVPQTLTSIAGTIEFLGQIATKAAETPTPTPMIIPSSGSHSPLVVFDFNSDASNCWQNETTEPLLWFDGFSRRADGNWKFVVSKGRAANQLVQTDFSKCIGYQISAFTINAWIARFELPTDLSSAEPEKEFGIFIEDSNGQKREYTVWIDKNKQMYLRVRENNQIILDNVILIVSDDALKIVDAFPRRLAEFPIQFFLEIDNEGSDILYMRQGSILEPVEAVDISPNLMTRIDNAVRPTFGNIQKFGLLGYGGETQMIVWPLVLYGK